MAPQLDRSASAPRRDGHAQPGSALFLAAATIWGAILPPVSGLFPDAFSALRRIAAGGFAGLGLRMFPLAHRISD